MKITINDINNVKRLLEKIHFDLEGATLVFPIDCKITTTDEFGIETTKYKAESTYGNKYVAVLAVTNRVSSKPRGRLAYCSTSNLISFDLAEYFALDKCFTVSAEIYNALTDEEKNYLSQFECCIIKKDLLILSDNSYDIRI